jgi:hypothetical protein
MSFQELEKLMDRTDLVSQKSMAVLPMVLTDTEGRKVPLFLQGCAVVSLYNALRLNDYDKPFTVFTAELEGNGCLERTGINWLAFNKLNTGLNFAKMQDSEIPGREAVDIKNLAEWVESGNSALIKTQSVFRKSRRHFMAVLEVDESIAVKCLESSDYSGAIRLRTIAKDEILGIRYFEKIPAVL